MSYRDIKVQIIDNVNNTLYSQIIVPELYLLNSEVYQDFITDFTDLYTFQIRFYDPIIAKYYFEYFLPAYYNNNRDLAKLDIQFKDRIKYITMAQYLIDNSMIESLAQDTAKYIRSYDFLHKYNNNNDTISEYCKFISFYPADVSTEIAKYIKISGIEYLIDRYPNKEFNYSILSMNGCISLDYILSHSNIIWNGNGITIKELTRNITLDPNDTNLYWNWNLQLLSRNPNLTEEFIENNINNLDMLLLSENAMITSEFVMKHQDWNWNWDYLLKVNRPNFKISDLGEIAEDIEQLEDEDFSQLPNLISYLELEIGLDKLIMPLVSKNSSITPEFVNSHPNWNWEWGYDPISEERFPSLSENTSITEEFVENNINKPWNWDFLAKNPALNSAFIELHSDKNWTYEDLAHNPRISLHYIERHIDWDWNYQILSNNPAITTDFVLKYPNNNWNLKILAKKVTIISDSFTKFLETVLKNTYIDELSQNDTLTYDIIENNIDLKWRWGDLSLKCLGEYKIQLLEDYFQYLDSNVTC